MNKSSFLKMAIVSLFLLPSFGANAALECSAVDVPNAKKLMWDPVNDSRLAGYRVWINGSATAEVAPDQTEVTIENAHVIKGSNAIYLTAFGDDPEIESDPSNTVEVLCKESKLESTVIRLGEADSGVSTVPIPDGMTERAVWSNPESEYFDLANVTGFFAVVDADLNSESSGIIFEAGASAAGSVLYAYDGKLYLQCGSGNGFLESEDRGEASWIITKNNPAIDAKCTTDVAELYIDGVLVSSSSFSNTKVAGSDAGSITGYSTNHPVTRLGGSYTPFPYSETVRSVTIYA